MVKIKPMLAQKYKASKIIWSDHVYMQPKLDGVRCIIQLNHELGEVCAYSRTGKPWLNINHILKNLKPFFDQHEDVILDGELYNHDLRDNFEKIISLVRKQKPTDEMRLESSKLVQFHCYDYINNVDNYEVRMNNLVVSDIYSYCVKFVPTHTIFREDDAKVYHNRNLAKGYEGSILRLNQPYQYKRSYALQKFKDFKDTEATIIGYVEGKGKRIGTLGKFLMQDDDGINFGCPPGKGYNYKDLTNILDNIDSYIGKRATFTYFQRTKANNYRHPMFKTIRDYE
jgi:ATP-dependent DNA ligase